MVDVTAFPLLIAAQARDPAAVSGVFLAARLPWLLVGLFSGAVVDRFDRRWVMAFANRYRGALLLLLAGVIAIRHINPLIVYVIAFMMGVGETLFDNASMALVPLIVRREHLHHANARLYAMEVLTNEFTGPALGGMLFAVAMAAPFALNALLFLISASLILSIAAPPQRARIIPVSPQSVRTEIGQGLNWLFHHRLLRGLAAIVALLSMLRMAGLSVLVLVAIEELGLSQAQYGFLLAGAAVGSLAGSAFAARLARPLGLVAALFGSIFVAGLTNLIIAAAASPYVVTAMLALNGFTVWVWNILTVSLRQMLIPNQLFGRVNSVYRLLAWGVTPIGAGLGGLLGHVFGLRAPFVVAGVVFVLLAFAMPVLIGSTQLDDEARALE